MFFFEKKNQKTFALWLTLPASVSTAIKIGRLHVEPVLLGFLAAYPNITARLVLADQVVNLVDEHVDVAVRVGELPDSLMVATRLGAVGWVTCASPRYLAARGTPETPPALEGHDCIMFEVVIPRICGGSGLARPRLRWRFARAFR